MNVLTQIKNQQKVAKRELESAVGESASWHDAFNKSAYIYAGGLQYDMTEGDLLAVFAQYGEIVDVNLVRDQDTGKSRGFAYMAYEDQRSTVLAVDNLNGARVLGRTLKVDHVQDYRTKKEEAQGADTTEGGAPQASGVDQSQWGHDGYKEQQQKDTGKPAGGQDGGGLSAPWEGSGSLFSLLMTDKGGGGQDGAPKRKRNAADLNAAAAQLAAAAAGGAEGTGEETSKEGKRQKKEAKKEAKRLKKEAKKAKKDAKKAKKEKKLTKEKGASAESSSDSSSDEEEEGGVPDTTDGAERQEQVQGAGAQGAGTQKADRMDDDRKGENKDGRESERGDNRQGRMDHRDRDNDRRERDSERRDRDRDRSHKDGDRFPHPSERRRDDRDSRSNHSRSYRDESRRDGDRDGVRYDERKDDWHRRDGGGRDRYRGSGDSRR